MDELHGFAKRCEGKRGAQGSVAGGLSLNGPGQHVAVEMGLKVIAENVVVIKQLAHFATGDVSERRFRIPNCKLSICIRLYGPPHLICNNDLVALVDSVSDDAQCKKKTFSSHSIQQGTLQSLHVNTQEDEFEAAMFSIGVPRPQKFSITKRYHTINPLLDALFGPSIDKLEKPYPCGIQHWLNVTNEQQHVNIERTGTLFFSALPTSDHNNVSFVSRRNVVEMNKHNLSNSEHWCGHHIPTPPHKVENSREENVLLLLSSWNGLIRECDVDITFMAAQPCN